MTNIFITIIAYLIDKFFGEFQSFRHPVAYMGDMITFYEKHFYKDSIFSGLGLVLFMIFTIGSIGVALAAFFSHLHFFLILILSALIASMFIAHNMLYNAVANILITPNKHQEIAMLVSRDTQNMSESDIYKAAIETYAENLSDGVVAPIFYLLFFGLPGILIYKAINTMDSMVAYRNERYEKFGKAAAHLDDIANYIPARITALLIMLFAKQKNLFAFYENGKKHESPNAGHPITAMALALGIKLGGDTSYFGKIKQKPHFGEGKEEITQEDVKAALNIWRF